MSMVATTPHKRTIPVLIKTAKVLYEKAVQAEGKAEQYYVSLGETLKELKERKPKDIPWTDFAAKHFPMIGRSRGYELLRLADGKTTVEKQRQTSREAVKKHRASNRPLRNGQSDVDAAFDLIMDFVTQGPTKPAPPTFADDPDDPPPVKGPKTKRETPPVLRKMEFELCISSCHVQTRKARKIITPLVNTLSKNWINGTVEEILTVMAELKTLADLLQGNQPNARGHLQVVSHDDETKRG